VESPDRFARDLIVQLTGHDFLKSLGIALIPATAPDFFTEDTPTAVLVHQVLGAIAQFDKASLVAKLRAARERKKAATGKCGGRRLLGKKYRGFTFSEYSNWAGSTRLTGAGLVLCDGIFDGPECDVSQSK
jgi:DNA invertase Pin-like site-specific DNA recombinase